MITGVPIGTSRRTREQPVQDADAAVAHRVPRVARVIGPVDREPGLARPLRPRLDRLGEAGEAEDVAAVGARGAAGRDPRPDEVPPGRCGGRRRAHGHGEPRHRPAFAEPHEPARREVDDHALPSPPRPARRRPRPTPPARSARSAAGSAARRRLPRRWRRRRRGAGAAVPTGCRPRGARRGARSPAPRARRARRPARRRRACLLARAA